MSSNPENKLVGQALREFVTAGKAFFTIQNPETGSRFTFKMTQAKNKNGPSPLWFVSVLTGPDNYMNYSYIGFVRDWIFVYGGEKAKLGRESKSVKAFGWLWRHLENPAPAVVWHEKKCCRCGRKLTTPESIGRGIGPECMKVAS